MYIYIYTYTHMHIYIYIYIHVVVYLTNRYHNIITYYIDTPRVRDYVRKARHA